MKEKEAIEAGYNESVKRLYNVFAQAWIDAAGDATARDAASQRFKKGLAEARAARDHALTLL